MTDVESLERSPRVSWYVGGPDEVCSVRWGSWGPSPSMVERVESRSVGLEWVESRVLEVQNEDGCPESGGMISPW